MKTSRSKYGIILITLLVYITTSPNLLLASDYYLNHMTSPQVTDMFRYGDVASSLFTGKVDLSIFKT